MNRFKGLTMFQSRLLVFLLFISFSAILFIACVFVKTACADSETVVYLADRDTDYDRVVGSGVRIGSSSYFSSGVCISTDPGQNLGSVVVIITADPNARVLELFVECRGEGKMFVVKNDITQKAGKPLGDTFDLLCNKPKIFYLYPASEYIDDEGNIEIHIGAQEGKALDVNYIRVRSLDYRPLSTRREARVVYDYPPTYVERSPSPWFAIYRGPYRYWDYNLGCWVSYYGWWDRPAYVSWYRPYYERVIVPVYREHHYYFYHEVPRHERSRVRQHYAGTHWRGERGKGGGRQYLGAAGIRDNSDRGGAYGAAPAKKIRSVANGEITRHESSSDRVREGTPRLSDYAIKSEGGDRGIEKFPSLDFKAKSVNIRSKRELSRNVPGMGSTGDLWTSSLQRAPRGVSEEQRSTFLGSQRSLAQRSSERMAGGTNVVGDFARNLKGNPTEEKIRRQQAEASQIRRIERVPEARPTQSVQREVLSSAREIIKRRSEIQTRPQPQPQPSVQPAPSSPAPAPANKEDEEEQKKQRRETTRGRGRT